ATEAVFPISKKGRGNDRSIMRPVFEKFTILFKQLLQIVASIGLVPGKQDHMMGTFERRYAVDLDKSQFVDQCQKIFLVQGTRRRLAKALPFQKDLPCLFVRDENRHIS